MSLPRNYPDFLSAYLKYSDDDFCPKKFHFWIGVSIVAAALERKVSIPFKHQNRFTYPNLYIFLLSGPGMGKSTALKRGTSLLEGVSYAMPPEVKGGEPVVRGINFLPQKMSQASLIEGMGVNRYFSIGGQVAHQCAGYFCASEASDCLSEIAGGGDIKSTLTALYDCDDIKKLTRIKGKEEILDSCLNLVAGCTYSFLNELIPRREIGGGFASRILYVIQDEIMVRHPKWDPAHEVPDSSLLLEDLQRIHNLSGKFAADREYIAAYEKFYPENDRKTQEMKNEHTQSFLSRKGSNIMKLSMILSVSQSDDLVLTGEHWEKAKELVEELEEKTPSILDKALDLDSQANINRQIMRIFAESGKDIVPLIKLRGGILMRGISSAVVDSTFSSMQRAGLIGLVRNAVGETAYKIFVNPHEHL